MVNKFGLLVALHTFVFSFCLAGYAHPQVILPVSKSKSISAALDEATDTAIKQKRLVGIVLPLGDFQDQRNCITLNRK